MMKKLIISPHIDDEVLGCGGILDEDTFVLYCGMDEAHIKHDWVRNRPSVENRLDELKSVVEVTKHSYDILHNKVNHYVIQDLIGSVEKSINDLKPLEIYIPHPSYNQDHRAVYEASLTALRPHDLNYFVKRVFVYEQPHVFFWNHGNSNFEPNYYVEIDILRKVELYELMKTQVRKFRSSEHVGAIAQLRGGQSGYDFAEAFQILRWVD